MCTACRDIFQTVDDKKSDCRIRKYGSEIFDKFRWIFTFRENNEWDKTRCHCSKDNCRMIACVVVIVILQPPPVSY